MRSAGLVRSVAARLRSEWRLMLAAWILIACATSLMTAAAVYSESAAEGGYHRAIYDSSPASSAVRVYAQVPPAEVPAADAAVAPAVARALGEGNGNVSLVRTFDGLAVAGSERDSSQRVLVA